MEGVGLGHELAIDHFSVASTGVIIHYRNAQLQVNVNPAKETAFDELSL